MSEAYRANSAGAGGHGDGGATAQGLADWLSLAATPTFAMMALMTMQQGSLWSGMVPMYLLMGAFHSAPWLRLIAGGRS